MIYSPVDLLCNEEKEAMAHGQGQASAVSPGKHLTMKTLHTQIEYKGLDGKLYIHRVLELAEQQDTNAVAEILLFIDNCPIHMLVTLSDVAIKMFA